MFVGHYGPSFAATAAQPRVKLWHAFVAVQLVDVAWGAFVLTGVEHVRITPGFTEANALDLYHMPYTHSLVMAVVWAVGAGALYGLVRRSAGLIGGAVIGLLVFSHWILDFLVHVPDLELWIGGPKVGLGLWRNVWISFPLEIGVMTAGFVWYMRATTARGRIGAIWPWLFAALLAIAQAIVNFGPQPANAQEASILALTMYAVLAAGAAGLDATRTPRAR